MKKHDLIAELRSYSTRVKRYDFLIYDGWHAIELCNLDGILYLCHKHAGEYLEVLRLNESEQDLQYYQSYIELFGGDDDAKL